jgi:xanthine/uracil permease
LPDKKEVKETSLLTKSSNENETELSQLPSEVVRFMMSQSVSSSNPLGEKITSEHIEKIIDSAEKDSEREFERDKLQFADGKNSRLYHLGYFVLSLFFVGFIIVFLKENPEMMKQIISIIIGLIAGFSAGFGVGRYNKKS